MAGAEIRLVPYRCSVHFVNSAKKSKEEEVRAFTGKIFECATNFSQQWEELDSSNCPDTAGAQLFLSRVPSLEEAEKTKLGFLLPAVSALQDRTG